MLKVKDLAIKINKREILNDISFDVLNGEFVSIIGGNGSGKSTLINTITKHIHDYEGIIIVKQEDLKNLNHKNLSKFLSTFAQHHETTEELTVYDIASFGRYPHKKTFSPLTDSDFDIIDEVLKELDIYDMKDRVITSLSGGELQRCYLASCLIAKPELLILDEPTNHLDIKHQYNLLRLIKDYSKNNNVTVICILHDINQAMKYSDKIAVLYDKKIYKYGKPIDIISEELIKKVFGIDNKLYIIEDEMHVDFIV